MVAQHNIVLVMSGLSPLQLVCICKDFPCLVGLVVDNSFCGVHPKESRFSEKMSRLFRYDHFGCPHKD